MQYAASVQGAEDLLGILVAITNLVYRTYRVVQWQIPC